MEPSAAWSPTTFREVATAYAEAATRAPGLRRRFEAAGFDPASIENVADLSRLPVLKKEELLRLQREDPPFAGFLAAEASKLSHIYVSPGPIFEPSFAGRDGHGLDALFRAAALGAGDVVLNTWSYHLVPAGMLFDGAARAVGATVIPGGTGNRELLAQVIAECGVTAICASTAFFIELADTVIEQHGRAAWKVERAFLGGEMGDWMAKRRRIEKQYGVSTWAAYATADLGLVAYEDGGEGYAVHPHRLVQICDPQTGNPVAPGKPGEIVVTTREAGWPMIRFGTGDSAFAVESAPDGQVLRLSALTGRVGAAVKIREIFVYPRVVEELVIAVPSIQRAQVVARRENGRETATIIAACEPGDRNSKTEQALHETFRQHARIRADAVTFVDQLPPDAPPIVNEKD